jgi:hypothetical protein
VKATHRYGRFASAASASARTCAANKASTFRLEARKTIGWIRARNPTRLQLAVDPEIANNDVAAGVLIDANQVTQRASDVIEGHDDVERPPAGVN